MPEELILFGAGSPVIVDFEEICATNDIEIQAIVNNYPEAPVQAILKRRIVSTEEIPDRPAPFMVPLFTPRNRFKAAYEALLLGLDPYQLLSDRHNDLPIHFRCGIGCFINKGVVSGAVVTLGNFVFINRGATLGHHLTLEDYVSIGPGVTTGGNVTIRYGAMIGTGATLAPEISVGPHAIVGAGAVVTKNVNEAEVVVGNPARVIKHNPHAF